MTMECKFHKRWVNKVFRGELRQVKNVLIFSRAPWCWM